MVMAKRVSIIQSNYIPWKGYFDIINSSDIFIIYDDAQYTRRDWRNRNIIKTPRGREWLTVPVETKGFYTAPINTIRAAGKEWAEKHWKTIKRNYSKTRYFSNYSGLFESIYSSLEDYEYLTDINIRLIKAVSSITGIKTEIKDSRDFNLSGDSNGRLISMCLESGADEYISGPSAAAYIDENRFREAGITLRWMDYSGYPEYPQLYPPFDHCVSILDLMFNTGDEAPLYMKSFGEEASA